MSDTVVIGGGVIGLSLAYELAGRGAGVTLLERGRLGNEASRVGAGIVTSGQDDVVHPALLALLRSSRKLLDEWSAALREETGIDDGLTWCGALKVAIGEDEAAALDREAKGWSTVGIDAAALAPAEARELEPALPATVARAYRLPYLGRAAGSGGLENLWIAAGHSRSGIELSAGSARALADLLAGASTEAGPEVDLSPFDPERTARLADRPRDHQPGGFS